MCVTQEEFTYQATRHCMPKCSWSHKMMLFAVWLLAGLHINLFQYCTGFQIQECNNGQVEVVENTASSLTCVDYTGTVQWAYILPNYGTIPAGTCSSTCTLGSTHPGFFTLTRLSDSSNRLGLTSTVTARRYAGTRLFCGSAECKLTVTVKAVLGALTVNLSNAGGGWTVSGTVPITKVFSSNGQYRCVWSRRHGNGQYTEVATQRPFNETNPTLEDKSGTCDFTDRLSDTTGTYTYRVQVYPGATEKIVDITSPPTPNISCTPSNGYVSEDTDMSCTCSGSVGRPAGRLVWVRRINDVDTRVKEGSDGQISLPLTMTVNRNHDGNELRCDVDWLTDITGPAQTVNVAYGPDSASIPESPVFYTDSAGTHSLTLTCEPRDVNPTTGLTYRWTGRCDGVTSEKCSFMPRPPDENGDGDVGATVQCTVTNTFNNKMAQGSFTLQLKYPPRVTPTIQGYVDNTTLYQGDSLNINCTVAGGQPTVTSVTLTCTGRHSQGPRNGQRSSLTLTSLNASDHDAVCTCSASWVKPKYYTLTATRTLTVYCKEQTTKLNSAALAGGLVAAVIIIGLVAGTLIFIKRRSEGSKAAEHNQQAAPSPGTAERADRPSYDVYEIQEFPAQNNYELLRLQDVRVRSEYAGFTPCVNSGADVANDSDVDAGFSLYANTGKKAVKSSGPVYVNTIPLCNRIYENVRGNN